MTDLINISVSDALGTALLGYGVVFLGLVLLMFVLQIMGKIMHKETAPAPAAPSAADEAVFHPFVFPAPGAGPSAPSIDTPPPESAEDDYDDLPPDDL